jgi:hypothetical protein
MRITWYRGQRCYSRRELFADTCLHLCALTVSLFAGQHLRLTAATLQSTGLRSALDVYSASLVSMWTCSAVYNTMSGRSDAMIEAGAPPARVLVSFVPSLELLKLADHAGWLSTRLVVLQTLQ